MKRGILLTLCLLLSFSLCACLYSTFIGEPVDCAQLNFQIQDLGDDLFLTFSHKEPSAYLTTIQQEMEGNALHIRVRKVDHTFGTQQAQLSIPKQRQDEIWIGGRLVWKNTP